MIAPDGLRAIGLWRAMMISSRNWPGGTEVRIEPGVDLFREGSTRLWWVLIDGAVDLLRRIGAEGPWWDGWMCQAGGPGVPRLGPGQRPTLASAGEPRAAGAPGAEEVLAEGRRLVPLVASPAGAVPYRPVH